MRLCKHTFIFVLLMCSSMIASGQSVYISRLKEAAGLLPSRAVEADSALRVILEEISAQQPPDDSLIVQLLHGVARDLPIITRQEDSLAEALIEELVLHL
ncbi:MAG: hypothetical protein ACKOZV_18040, partial [Bacteroidota bacterium]